MMGSLYELTTQFLQFKNWLEENDLDDQAAMDTLEALQMPLEEKVENIVKYMRTLEALADAKKLEAKRLSESASADLKKVEWFKSYMADNLKKAGITKLQAGVFALGFRKGSEVIQVDETLLPDEYWIDVPTPLGKKELKDRVKLNGETIPGVSIIRKPDSLVVK
jgi:hypothetical protein